MLIRNKGVLNKVLKLVKFSDGYAVNISKCVNVEQRKIPRLKSHEYNVLM